MNESAPSFPSWNRSVAEAIAAVGSDAFAARLEAMLGALAVFEMMNGFLYAGGRAFDLHNTAVEGDRDVIVDRYLAGAFLLDPFHDAIRADPRPRMLSMREVAPDDFHHSEYHRRHYRATGISDEIGFVLALADGAVGILSLSRRGEAAMFSRRELRLLGEAALIVCALGGRHWFEAGRNRVGDGAAGPTIDHPLLTKRETEIVTLILKGHSSGSIAGVLGVSPNTVKVHRQHVYAKLEISSQAELFHLFLG